MNFGLPLFAVFGLAALLLWLAILWQKKLLKRPEWILRSAALAALLLAASGLQIQGNTPGLVVLEDVSDSVSAAPAELSRLKTLAHFDFAGLAGEHGTPSSALQSDSTNIESALDVAKSSQATRILLLSDGNDTETNRDTETLSNTAAQDTKKLSEFATSVLPGVPIDVFILPTRDNVHLGSIEVPGFVAPGARVQLRAKLQTQLANTTQNTKLSAELRLNGEVIETRQLLPHNQILEFHFIAPTTGENLDVQLQVKTNFAEPKTDNISRANLRLDSPNQILVIGDPAMAKLLRTQGLRVTESGTGSISGNLPNAVVYRGSATALTRGQLELLAGHVENGGGLMLTGSPQSFGLGGWARSNIENVLPVRSELITKIELPDISLMMLVDHSLSMAGGNPQKLGMAIEGVASVIELSGEHDELGLMVFAEEPKWIFEPLRANENNKSQMLRALDTVQAEGGTILLPAYTKAIARLQESQSSVKQLILLTDGQLSDSENQPAPDFASLARGALQMGIHTTTIALGNDADLVQLKKISSAGGGRFYKAENPESLPKLFSLEAMVASRALVRKGNIQPIAIKHPLFTTQIFRAGTTNSIPHILSYIATTPQEEAEPILNGLNSEPILSVKRYGLGRSAALTIDLNQQNPLNQWTQLGPLLASVVRWLDAPTAPFRLSFSPDGTRAIVDAVSQNKYLNNQALQLQTGNNRINMKQTAPGRYEAMLPTTNQGEQTTIRILQSGRLVAKAEFAKSSNEFETQNGTKFLTELASATGGNLITNLKNYKPATARTGLNLTPWLALLAALLFFTELIYRRFWWAG